MKSTILQSPKDFFGEAVREAFIQRRIDAGPHAEAYLVRVLEHYILAERLFDEEAVDELGNRKPQTLAETLLVAVQSSPSLKADLLKKLGDRTLYTCGFFSDSFERKVIDVDYCVEMAGTAYGLLANSTREDTLAHVYTIYSRRFIEFVEALNYISEKFHLQSTDNVLRIYDRYLRTGSELAREKLNDLGIVPISPTDQKKVSQF